MEFKTPGVIWLISASAIHIPQWVQKYIQACFSSRYPHLEVNIWRHLISTSYIPMKWSHLWWLLTRSRVKTKENYNISALTSLSKRISTECNWSKIKYSSFIDFIHMIYCTTIFTYLRIKQSTHEIYLAWYCWFFVPIIKPWSNQQSSSP